MTLDPYASLRALFVNAGYAFVEPPLLHDASVFVEVAGEDLRRRMFLTSDGNGRELALRPEYTVPVCLHHLETGAAARRASYAYLGSVFRQRKQGPREFPQGGIESLGRRDSLDADADVLALAFAAEAELGVAGAQVTIGDSGLFSAVLDAIDLAEPWRRRLKRTFGEAARLRALIAGGADARRPRSADDPASVREKVAELFLATGLGVMGARGAGEIAERFMEKGALADGIGTTAAGRLGEFLAIGGSLAISIRGLKALARSAHLAITPAIDRFQERADAFADRGIDVSRLSFAADFGRRLDYYTGFVFEFYAGADAPSPVIGGGRYDRLLSLMHHPRAPKRDVPAVGFAVWLDRVP